jgi:Cu+-exporting ATPase
MMPEQRAGQHHGHDPAAHGHAAARRLTPSTPSAPAEYTCPMHPEIRQPGPGSCPACGMALEPVSAPPPLTREEWTCPMHPEIVRPAPSACPICGMALERRTVAVDEGPDPELADMTRRFWIGLALAIPLLVLAMGDMVPGEPLRHLIPAPLLAWGQLALATPVVLWGGWPFFIRGWRSIVNRRLRL